jgi:hypothetical protein
MPRILFPLRRNHRRQDAQARLEESQFRLSGADQDHGLEKCGGSYYL